MNNDIIDANLQALLKTNPEIFSYLKTLDRENKKTRYTFRESQSGEKVPFYSAAENSNPLHSTVDPKREAQRIVSTITDDAGFLVFLGLGGGFSPQEALDQTRARVLVIDFCLNDIADLFFAKDYSKLLNNGRFTLLIDPSNDDIKNFLIEHYNPSIYGGIQTIPLRTRTCFNMPAFNAAADAIQEAIDIVSSDFSVQAHFGKRWFSNIIRNVKFYDEKYDYPAFKNLRTPINEAAIAAAGPSLDRQLAVLCEYKSRKVFIISSDTALPALLNHGIEPDAVVSIDCQHISYYHFLGVNLRNIPLILDIASPPALSSFTTSPNFFSSGHPFSVFVSQNWRNIPMLDTSGGNVTYACLSFAEILGARHITLFGADFSYVNSAAYARGTYIYPFFEKKQNRLSSIEALFSAFLYRSPFIPAEDGLRKNYHETSSLRFYRKKLEEKAEKMNARIISADGQGAPVNLPKTIAHNKAAENRAVFTEIKTQTSGIRFLEQYRAGIAALPQAKDMSDYFYGLSAENRKIFTTLLPYAASVKRRNPPLKAGDLIEETKRLSITEIDRILIN